MYLDSVYLVVAISDVVFVLVLLVLGVMHGKTNFFCINFGWLNFSKTKDYGIRIKSRKYY
jgi:hypothetical protein